MLRLRCCVFAGIFCGFSGQLAAAAGAFEPKLTEVCSPSPDNPKQLVLDHKMLVGQFVEKSLGISPIDLDKKRDKHQLDSVEKLEADAFLDPDIACPHDADGKDTKDSPCADKVGGKLRAGQVVFLNFLKRHAGAIDPTKDSIDTQNLAIFAFDKQKERIRQFVRGEMKPDVAICYAAPSAASKSTPAPSSGADAGGNKNQTPQTPPIPQYFSLRQTVEELPIPQSSSDFKGTKQANVSFTDDWVATKASYTIVGAAGYTFGRFSLDEAGHYLGQITPFITYNQQTVQTADPKKNTSAQNFGFGVLGDITFPTGFGGYQNVKFYPKYVDSLRNDAQVLSGNFVYTPEYGIPGIDSALYLIVDALSVKFTPQLKVVTNDVVNAGTGTTALKTGSYYWFGPYLDLKLFGEGIFSGFTYDVSYETYDVTGGTLKQLSYFQTSLGYDFGTAKLMSIVLKYQNGRNLDTLEKINLLTLGFGLKY